MNHRTPFNRRVHARSLPRAAGLLFGALLGWNAVATNHILRQDELMVGLNGDPNVQFIQITVSDGTQKSWGPGPGESTSRAMLVFFNGAGIQTGQFFFPNNAPIGQNTVLIATTNFANLAGAPTPDFIIPPLLSPGSGKVCFRGNPNNRNAFGVNLCLSYGNFPANQTEGGGPPAPALPMVGEPMSLTRGSNFGFNGATLNSDFVLATPTPLNTLGQTIIFTVDGPEIDSIPVSVNFGSQNMNAGPTAAQTVVITNKGVINPLIITNVSLVGNNANQFSVVTDSGQTVLSAGGTRTLAINFDPSSPGVKTASVRVVSNDGNENIFAVPLQGTGFDPNAPEINVAPVSINFGLQNVTNGATATTTVTVVNQGLIGSLFVTNIFLAGTDASQFRITGATNASTLPAGANRTVSVAFDPDAAGLKNAVLRVISSDTDESVSEVVLQGRAFDLNPCTAPNPTNTVAQDVCTNAQLICPDFVFTGTTLGATADGSSTCGSGAGTPDVWYRYLPSANGTAVVAVTGITFTPTVSAHSGCPGVLANQLVCDSAIPRQAQDASITFPVTNGVSVFVRIAGGSGVNSSFQLTVTGPPCVEFDRNRNGVTDSCELDFGDAPAPYPTTLSANGARHGAFTGVFLGKLADSNGDGLPSPLANGDNLEGPPNDDDGVTFVTSLVVGQSAALRIEAAAPGFLSGWIDFNRDGDWADASEQVFTNVPLQSGLNALAINVPNGATATNLTFARFRFSTVSNLSVIGAAPDGEVEDYAVEILPLTQIPGGLGVRISEVMAGLNGDSTAQFVELEVNGAADKLWGRQGAETAGRAMLAFFDSAGRQAGRFVFPSNAPSGGNTILVATRAFALATGLTPDFIMPPEVVSVAGKVAFQNNPDNSHFNINVALSYGGNGYFGLTDGAGAANTNELPVLHTKSLTRTANVPFGLNQNAAFQLATATPRNSAGVTVSLTESPVVEQGRVLFMRETFRGNGRTCATCHVPGRDQFGLTPLTIAQLDEDDPLFIFENNVNLLKLVGRSQPSDLRGAINGTLGNARVLSGSGDTYLVVGGTNFSGPVTDTNGNSGLVQSFALGDLDGPTASNGSERGLESHDFLEHGRGLILENIDGFKRSEVFRASPHLLNLALTAPYGLSGEFSNLEDFSAGAVMQHFPKSLARASGTDFRHPTREELEAMTAFMIAIANPPTNQLNLDRFATTQAQKRGRALFFGDEGRCFKCHSGAALNLSDGSLPGSTRDRNDDFNTGVANIARNIFDLLPTEPAGLVAGESARKFNTPSLMNIRLTAPFFHDGSADTLKDAIKFYDSEEFHDSPAGQDVGSLLGANKSDLADDLVAFLESLTELPVDFTRAISFGIHCPGNPVAGVMTATITNIFTNTITITNVVIRGTNAADFNIAGDTGQTNLAPGQTRSIQIAFAPAAMGVKKATLEVTALDTNLLGRFDFAVALDGAEVDNVVQSSLTNFNFGTRDIDAPPSPEESIVISNEGSTDLEIAIEFLGPNVSDFTLLTETNAIPAHGSRVIQVSFAPQTQGAKSALVQLRMVSCTGTNIEIALSGLATSTVHHFAWDAIATNQFVGTPVPVRIVAQDRNNELVASFHGTVKLMSLLGAQTNIIAITPTNSAPFSSAIWTGTVTVLQPAAGLRLLARDNAGHAGASTFFNASLRDDVSLAATDSPDPVLNGQPITYILTVSNSGPTTATGVLITNQLSPNVNLVSAVTSQGSVSQLGNAIVADIGALGVTTATVTIVVEPLPGFSFVTNIASVVRNELEAVPGNNRATNVTLVGSFGLLIVTPSSNFVSSGFSGGPFAPTNQFYTLSNSGTVSLNWQLRGGSSCASLPGMVGLWQLDGDTTDSANTNSGVLLGSPVFTNGLVGPALFFDGVDDGVRIAAAPAINVGAANGMTIELWINPADVSSQRPLVEWSVNESVLGAHLWTAVAQQGGGPRSLWINLIDVNGINHELSSGTGFIQSNVWQHVAMTYSRTTGVATLYRNGVAIRIQNLGSFVPRTTGDLFLGRRSPFGFAGSMDDVGIYDRALSTAEILSIFTIGVAGKCDGGSGASSNCNTPAGAVAWWPFDGNANDTIGTNIGTLVSGPAFINGKVAQALSFDGVNDHVEVAGSPSLNIGAGPGFTTEAWINPSEIGREQAIVEYVRRSGGLGFHFYYSQITEGGVGSLFANIIDTTDTSHHINSPAGLVQTGVWQHVACTYDKAIGQARLYLNGVVVAQATLGIFTPQTSPPFDLFIGQRIGNFFNMAGGLDELTLYDRALSTSEITAIFQAGSAGKCQGSSWYAFAPAFGSLAAGALTNVNVFLTPAVTNLPIGLHFDSLAFTNSSNGRGSTSRVVQVNVLNRRPTLASLSPVIFAEDSGSHVVNFTGVTAGSNETQVLTVTATSSDPALIANPIAVNYTSPATSGSLAFTTLTNANGTATVSVVVRDSGSSFAGGLDAVTNTFLVTITPVNDRPSLAFVPNQSVNEETLFTMTNLASDPDLPNDLLSFSLLTPSVGASIDPATGVLTWTPGEQQGPGSNEIAVVVSDSGIPSLKATNRFTITVLDVNAAPLLSPFADYSIHNGISMTLTAAATDLDFPINAISYALGAGAPPGASINSSNGLFSWTAGAIAFPTTNLITVIATDNGQPPLSDSKSFQVVVLDRPRIQSIMVEGTNVLMNWTAVPGTHYRVQFKPNLQTTNWVDIPGDITATNSTAGKNDLRQPSQRFYQIRVLP